MIFLLFFIEPGVDKSGGGTLTVVEDSATFRFADTWLRFRKSLGQVTAPKFWKIYKALTSPRTHPKRGGLPPACLLKNCQNFKGSPTPPPKEGKLWFSLRKFNSVITI